MHASPYCININYDQLTSS